MRSIFTANTTALVTGASSGIGLEIARAMAPKVESLILVARRLGRLEEVAKELQSRFPTLRITVLPTDLSVAEEVQKLLQQLETRSIDVDVLVNNAGFGEYQLYEKSAWDSIHQMVAVNVLALLSLSHHLLPAMVARGHGAILNIGSGAGYLAMPNAAVYTASKHFVRAFTESLRAQLADTGIVVSEAAPGPVESEFSQVAGIADAPTSGQTFIQISSKACAAEILRELEKGTPVIFPGRRYRWLMKTRPLIPRRLVAAQLAKSARARRLLGPLN